MRRKFIEAYIPWNWKTRDLVILENFLEFIKIIKKIGYSGLSLIYKVTSLNEGIPLSLFKHVKKISEREQVEFISRAEITAKRPSSVKRILRKVRKHFELVSMIPMNREQMTFACRDGRIDIVTILPLKIIKLYKGDLRNLVEEGKVIELLISPFRGLPSLELANALHNYSKLINTLNRKGVRFIISAGVSRAEEIPDPYSKAAFLEILGVKPDEALRAVSTHITELVERNRKKLYGKMPVRGVEVLEEDTDMQ